MKRWTKRTGIAITTLILFASQVSIALARAGGGKGGSLGGSAGKSFGSGGYSGGFSGGFSGGYSGGFGGGFHSFFPFFYFGGPSYGAGSFFGGLLSLIFLLVILYLVYRAVRSARRRRQGRFSGGFGLPQQSGSEEKDELYDYPANTPVDITGKPITNEGNLQRFARAINYTRENMRYYAETFPRWDRNFLIGRVRQVFFWLQDAWTRQDLSGGEEYLTPALLDKYKSDLEAMKARGERNVIKEPVLHPGDIEFIYSNLDEQGQSFIVMIAASLIDYTVDAAGRIIAGEDDNRLYFTEFWEFIWQGDKWVLANIYQEDSLEVAKIARGDEF